jgi:Ca2+-binding RTX toxin-like protein
MGTANLTINNAHGSNPSTVALGTGTGTTVFTSSSTGVDTVTAGATGQSISTGGGDDVVNALTTAIFYGGTYNGGAGTNDVLNITAAGADTRLTLAATAVANGAAAVTGFEVINVTIDGTGDVVTITPDAAVTVNFVGAVAGDITVTGTGGAVTANAAAGQQLTVNGTGNVTVGATNTTGTIIFSTTKTAGTNSVTAYAGNQTVTNNSTIVTTIDGALLAGNTETLSGAGAFTVNGLVGTGTIAAAAATGVITVNGTTAGARTVNTGSAADVITITGTAAAIQTITTLGGNDTVTLTTTGGANVVDLGAGNDIYTAGTAGGSVTGGAGSDSMTGGAGADVFIYTSAADSSGVNTDTITGLNFNADIIRHSVVMSGTTFDATTATSTTVGFSNFNASSGVITVLANDGTLTINTASSTNTPTSSGTLSGTSLIQYVVTATDTASTITLGAGNDTVTGGAAIDTINTGAGNDSISGGLGADQINGGAGQDTITSGGGADVITILSGQAQGAIGGTLNAGTITGFDVITDLTTGTTAASKDLIEMPGTGAIATAGAGVNGTDSTLTIGGSVVAVHTISATGLFSATDGTGAVVVTSDAGLAAFVQYLTLNDIGNAGMAVVFTATYGASTRGSTAHSFIYSQNTDDAGGVGGYSLVDIVGVTLTGIEATASTTDLRAFIS